MKGSKVHTTNHQAEVIKKVDLVATFSTLLTINDYVEIEIKEATEGNVRAAAARYSKETGVKLSVSAPLGTDFTTVTRVL